MNRKKTQRLYREEGLLVRKRKGRKRAAGSRAPILLAWDQRDSTPAKPLMDQPRSESRANSRRVRATELSVAIVVVDVPVAVAIVAAILLSSKERARSSNHCARRAADDSADRTPD